MTQVPTPFSEELEEITDPNKKELARISFYTRAVYTHSTVVTPLLLKISEEKELDDYEQGVFSEVCESFNADPKVVSNMITEKNHDGMHMLLDEKINMRYSPCMYPEAVRKIQQLEESYEAQSVAHKDKKQRT